MPRPPRRVRYRVSPVLACIAIAVIAACSTQSSKTPTKAGLGKKKLTPAESIAALSNVSTTWFGNGPPEGHTIARGESHYALIENDSCGGVRQVETHFETTANYLVQMTEDNTQLNCTEGVITRPIVVVWLLHHGTSDPYDYAHGEPDTIRPRGMRFRVIGGDEGAAPLLESESEEQSGMGPSQNAYYSLSTRTLLFLSNSPPQSFLANGVRRYIGISGVGDKETLATIAYGSGAGPMQIVRIPAPSGVEAESEVEIDSVLVDGPMVDGGVVLRKSGKDTVAVSGVGLRIHVSITGTIDYAGDFSARITNDRFVLDTVARAGANGR
ncbi:MAG TPA: hypothetical protein VGM50_03555 [Gemmatimonadaceae bacterium]